MNKELINEFEILLAYYKKTGDRGRSIAYNNGIAALRGIPYKITKISQVKGIRGIGPKIREKIEEFLEKGNIHSVEEKKEELKKLTTPTKKEKILVKFQKIWGIGPSKAKKLYDSGIYSIKDLKKNMSQLTDQQKIGLKYYKDLLLKVPRHIITAFQVIIMFYLNKKSEDYKIQIAGSYRRKAQESGDMDCLISSKVFSLADIAKILVENKVVTDVLAVKNTKLMGIAYCSEFGYFRLDIEFVPECEWGSALLYFTGSKGFNQYMRLGAKKQGFLLNEHGLFDAVTMKKVMPSPSEKHIFAFLGMQYVAPEYR